MNRQFIVAAGAAAIAIVIALAPLYRTGDLTIPQHHVFHAILLALTAFAGITYAGVSSSEEHKPGWLIVAMIAPVLAMAAMWPSEYSYFETHRFGHAGEHFGLSILGFLTGYGGQRYANGVGWATGLGLVVMALLAAWGYGVAPPNVV